MELAVAVVVGVILFAVWSVALESKRHGTHRGQEQVTDVDAVPPLMPDDPTSGSRRHRRSCQQTMMGDESSKARPGEGG